MSLGGRSALFGACFLPLGGCVPAGVEGFVVAASGAVAGADGEPIAGAAVTFVDGAGDLIGEVTSGEDGRWAFPVYATEANGNVLRAAITADGLADGAAEWEVNLLNPETATLRGGPGQDWESVDRPLACVRLDESASAGSLHGTVVDPSGAPVGGLAGVVQRGWNASIGAASVSSFTTASDGSFGVLVDEPGVYTVYVSPSAGWAGTRFPVFTGTSGAGVTATIAPLQEPGRFLASLTWTSGADLDLHLTGPEAASTTKVGRFHVWADAPTHPERPPEDDAYIAQLTRAATSGPGPEVVVVNQLLDAGQVHLSVMNRSGADETESVGLAESDALVQWWAGEDVPRYAWVSPLARDTVWRPAEIDSREATVYAVETYASGVDPADDDAF